MLQPGTRKQTQTYQANQTGKSKYTHEGFKHTAKDLEGVLKISIPPSISNASHKSSLTAGYRANVQAVLTAPFEVNKLTLAAS